MSGISRRSFLKAAGAAGTLGALAACSNDAAEQAPVAIDADYPIEPEEFGSVEVKYTIEEMAGRTPWFRVTNEGGAVLGVADKALLIQVDGLCFKDLNGNGKLDLYEDWRQDANARAADIVTQMDAEEILPELTCSLAFYVTGDIGTRVDDTMKELADMGIHQVQGGHWMRAADVDGKGWSAWSNQLQAYAEGKHLGIPMHVYADPFDSTLAAWPDSVGLAATFDPECAAEYGRRHADMWRAVGVHTVLGPQMDTATDPRWARYDGTFGEDPALSRDMAKAEVEALQTTYGEDGSDQGWGINSIVCMVKHWPGDGAGMFGWESHNRGGRFSQFDGGNFDLQLIPFVDGAFKLDSSTTRAAAVMPSYSIAYSEDEEYGENVGSAFSEYKINLLRKTYGFDGQVCTDWQVIDNGEEEDFHIWGTEDLTPAERVLKCWNAGVDQFGGQDDLTPIHDGYELLKEQLGEEGALERIRESMSRILLNTFRLGLFENVYLDIDASTALVDGEEQLAAAHDVSVKSIIMLKNDGVIAGTDERLKVYVPKVFTPASENPPFMGGGVNPSSFELPVAEEVLTSYFDIVTDSLADTLTGDLDDEGNPMIAEADIVRATSEELADCDFALVFATQPQNAYHLEGVDQEGNYIPVSLQFRPYTANAESGCPEESFCGSFEGNEADIPHGPITASGKENMSPFGNTSVITNEAELDLMLSTAELMPKGKKVIVCVNSEKGPIITSEFEPQVGAILLGFRAPKDAFLDIVAGKAEPSGLLPCQMPKDMHTVETQLTDTPRDLECYVDSMGNTYDFGFGLNWSGVIDDERTAAYCVAPIMTPESKG